MLPYGVSYSTDGTTDGSARVMMRCDGDGSQTHCTHIYAPAESAREGKAGYHNNIIILVLVFCAIVR